MFYYFYNTGRNTGDDGSLSILIQDTWRWDKTWAAAPASPFVGASWGCTWWSPIFLMSHRGKCGPRVNTDGSSACWRAHKVPKVTHLWADIPLEPGVAGILTLKTCLIVPVGFSDRRQTSQFSNYREAKQTCEYLALHTCGTKSIKWNTFAS